MALVVVVGELYIVLAALGVHSHGQRSLGTVGRD